MHISGRSPDTLIYHLRLIGLLKTQTIRSKDDYKMKKVISMAMGNYCLICQCPLARRPLLGIFDRPHRPWAPPMHPPLGSAPVSGLKERSDLLVEQVAASSLSVCKTCQSQVNPTHSKKSHDNIRNPI